MNPHRRRYATPLAEVLGERFGNVRPSWGVERATRLVEDIIRVHPQGASTRVLLERLTRAGVEIGEAVAILRALEWESRIATDGERWMLLAP